MCQRVCHSALASGLKRVTYACHGRPGSLSERPRGDSDASCLSSSLDQKTCHLSHSHTHTHTLILTWQIQQDRPRQHNMLTCGTSCHLTGCTALWCKRSSCVLRALCSTCFPFLFFFLVSAHGLLPAAPRLPKNIQDAAAVLHPGLFYLKRKVKCDKQRACANFYWRKWFSAAAWAPVLALAHPEFKLQRRRFILKGSLLRKYFLALFFFFQKCVSQACKIHVVHKKKKSIFSCFW